MIILLWKLQRLEIEFSEKAQLYISTYIDRFWGKKIRIKNGQKAIGSFGYHFIGYLCSRCIWYFTLQLWRWLNKITKSSTQWSEQHKTESLIYSRWNMHPKVVRRFLWWTRIPKRRLWQQHWQVPLWFKDQYVALLQLRTFDILK